MALIGSRNKWLVPTENLKIGDIVQRPKDPMTKLEARTNRRSFSRPRRTCESGGCTIGGKVMRRPIHKLSHLEANV